MEKLQIASKILLSIALIYFATAIIMFTLEAGRTREAIPDIIGDIDRMKMDADIPMILGQISEITEEVSQIRKEIPSILREVEETRKTIPPILKRVDEINRLIPDILKQIEETRKTVPPVLKEVAAVREELPKSLDKAQKIVDDVKEINVVGGVAKGVGGVTKDVVTSPLKLLKKGADKVTGQDD